MIRLALDVVLYRLLLLVKLPGAGRERTVFLKPGVTLTYRLNRGDILAVREVWMDEVYELPFQVQTECLVDLGANIGLASLWLTRRYGFSRIVAVEPLQSNVRLLQVNLAQNGIVAEIIQAAVARSDGTARFEASVDSNAGRLGDAGEVVETVSMESVLERLPRACDVDLLKIDIEGAEAELLEDSPRWLPRVRSILVEIHQDLVDAASVVAAVKKSGMLHVNSGIQGSGEPDGFVRA